MVDASKIADKYIARDGGPPAMSPAHTSWATDVVIVSSFILWQPEHAMWGGQTRDKAFDSLMRLLGIKDIERLRAAIRKD